MKKQRENELKKKQGYAAVEWVVEAVKLAYLSPDLKARIRSLLIIREFAVNLGAFMPAGKTQTAFDYLRAELKTHHAFANLRTLQTPYRVYSACLRNSTVLPPSSRLRVARACPPPELL